MVTGATLEAPGFHVDNNSAPFAVMDDISLVLSLDTRSGVPIPFRLFDFESDRLRVLVQWRRQGDPFPDLPVMAPDLIDLLDNPGPVPGAPRPARRHGGATGVQREDRVPSLDCERTRRDCPTLRVVQQVSSASESRGRRWRFLRLRGDLQPASWSPNPLNGPVAVLSHGDGQTRLRSGIRTLRAGACGSSSSKTGNEIQTFASGNGCAARDDDGPAAYPALRRLRGPRSSGSIIRVARRTASSCTRSPLGRAGSPRWARRVVIATGDASLVRVDYSPRRDDARVDRAHGAGHPLGRRA